MHDNLHGEHKKSMENYAAMEDHSDENYFLTRSVAKSMDDGQVGEKMIKTVLVVVLVLQSSSWSLSDQVG